jgi:parallel beta-helix repeat protein
MSKKALSVVALALMVVGLRAESVLAKTVVVEGDGLATCNPGPAHFTTIQAAVNAVSTFPGSTVLVCPGSYPEQVVISQPLTLRGIVNGTGNAAGNAVVITVPPGGLLPNVTTPAYGSVAAQLVVQNIPSSVANVTLRVQGIAVDGLGGTCPTLVGATRSIGIVLLNVGDASALIPASVVPSGNLPAGLVPEGFISNDVVRNENDGCTLGEAIDSENSYITITGNEIHNYDLDGVVVNGGTVYVTGNNIQGGVFYGVSLHSANQSNVIDNNIVGTEDGVLLDALPGQAGTSAAIVNGNIMGPFTGVGINLDQVSGNTIKNNEINISFLGVSIFESSGNIVQGNTTFNMHYGIFDELSGGLNVITNNTVNEAAFGIVVYESPGTTDILTPNNLVNCTVTTTTNPF